MTANVAAGRKEPHGQVLPAIDRDCVLVAVTGRVEHAALNRIVNQRAERIDRQQRSRRRSRHSVHGERPRERRQRVVRAISESVGSRNRRQCVGPFGERRVCQRDGPRVVVVDKRRRRETLTGRGIRECDILGTESRRIQPLVDGQHDGRVAAGHDSTRRQRAAVVRHAADERRLCIDAEAGREHCRRLTRNAGQRRGRDQHRVIAVGRRDVGDVERQRIAVHNGDVRRSRQRAVRPGDEHVAGRDRREQNRTRHIDRERGGERRQRSSASGNCAGNVEVGHTGDRPCDGAFDTQRVVPLSRRCVNHDAVNSRFRDRDAQIRIASIDRAVVVAAQRRIV